MSNKKLLCAVLEWSILKLQNAALSTCMGQTEYKHHIDAITIVQTVMQHAAAQGKIMDK